MAGNPTLPTENIDEVILGLLALEPNEIDELDYETYKSLIKEVLIEVSKGRRIGDDENNLLRSEFKRVKTKKGRFRVKKTKINADKLGIGGIRKQIKGTQKRLMLAPSGGALAKTYNQISKPTDSGSDILTNISNTLQSILNTLIDINKENKKSIEKARKEEEGKKREGREKELESKTFEGIKKVISTVTKPFQSIWDILFNFIKNIILGRIFIKLISWIADPNNQGKIRSVIRFFKDHWPVLLAAYLRFGTGLGKFVGLITKIVVRGAIRFGAIAAQLLASAGLKKFGKVASFLGGPRGRLLGKGIEVGAAVGGTLALGAGIDKLMGGNEEPPVPKFAGGGWSGGLKNLFGNMFSGLVKGPKGKDKVPGMLTDGEFVMSAGAVRKYGVDTLEGMNAAGGGTNVPKIADGITYAAGGGFVGETPKEIRTRRAYEYRFGEDFTKKLTNEQLSQISKYYNSFPADEATRIDSRRVMGYPDEIKVMAEKMLKGNVPQSFTQSSRTSSGLDDLVKKFDMDARTAQRYGENLPKLNRPKPRIPRIDPSRMLPAAGQSSANAMRAAARTARVSRPPIPASSAIVPYTGGGLVRTGVTGGLSVPQIRTNMKVPGGFGNLKSFGAELLANYLMDAGFDKVNAMIVAKKITDAKKLKGKDREKYIENLRNVVDKEQRWQKGLGGIYDNIIGMGKESSSQKMSRSAQAILGGLGVSPYQGGAIRGGYGLKEQSFKDMPKTQIMTDDKGRPFVGYKAMRGGKPVYVRGPKPGEGTTNPFEALGRMINPGAYKDIDALNARKKYEEASAGNLASLKARGASQVTLAKTGQKLKKSVPPLPKPKPKASNLIGGKSGRQRSRAPSPSNSQRPRSQNPTHSSRSTRTARSTLGINK